MKLHVYFIAFFILSVSGNYESFHYLLMSKMKKESLILSECNTQCIRVVLLNFFGKLNFLYTMKI